MTYSYHCEIYKPIDTEAIAKGTYEIKSLGYTILKNYVSNNYINQVTNELVRIHSFIKDDSFKGFESSLPRGDQGECLKNDINICHLPIYSKIFINMGLNGDHLKILKNILNDIHYQLIPNKFPNFILAQMNARIGLNNLPCHNDVRLQMPGEKTFSVQGFLALDELSEKNGTLKLVPKTHTSGSYPNHKTTNESEVLNLSLNSGDLVLFDSRLHHATATNNNHDHVWTILYTYRSWWVKPQFDFWRYFENYT